MLCTHFNSQQPDFCPATPSKWLQQRSGIASRFPNLVITLVLRNSTTPWTLGHFLGFCDTCSLFPYLLLSVVPFSLAPASIHFFKTRVLFQDFNMEPFLTCSISRQICPLRLVPPLSFVKSSVITDLKNVVSLPVSIVFSLCQNGGRSLRQSLGLYIFQILAIQLVLKYVSTWLKKIVTFTSLCNLTSLSQTGVKMGGRL